MTKLETRFESLTSLSVVEQADAVARGDTTAVALTEAALAAFELQNPSINAVIWLQQDAALEAATALDAMQRTGRPLGPLHGVPLAHKDMYYQAGKPCTCGSDIRKNFVPDYTATVIERLHAAGSLTLGGLNMAEFAQNPTGHNAHFGDCCNPWDLAYCTGGSSSGSGAAVAARCVGASLGSDTGGSIRLPAALCGVTGIKGTQTRVSRYGVMPLSFSADNVGPLARSARDCARIMSVIAGYDANDPTSATDPVPDYEGALTGDIRGLRVGVPTNYFFDDIDDEVNAAFVQAMTVLADRGAVLVPVTLPHMADISAYGGIISRCEGAAIHGQWMRDAPQSYSVHLSARLYGGNAIPAVMYLEALNRRGGILRSFAHDVFGACDVFVAPALRTKVPTRHETDIDSGRDGTIEAFMNVSINTRPANYLGLPSASVPCGFDSNGLPIGLLIHGRPFAEGRVLKVADAYQRDTDWHLRRPPIAA
ncbi:MAG: amidase [Rhodobacteraceae bacterium]|nr:amidase [Paracoccaceae bacterium]